MKRIILAGWTILAFGFFPVLAQEKAPAIVFDTESRDFGKVTEGQDLKHVFKFTNKGESMLDILGVEPG